MADLECWDDTDYRGELFGTSESVNDLSSFEHRAGGNWSDEIVSWRVNAGQWRFFENVNYGGLATQILNPGDHVRSCPDAGFPNNWVSSIQRVG